MIEDIEGEIIASIYDNKVYGVINIKNIGYDPEKN